MRISVVFVAIILCAGCSRTETEQQELYEFQFHNISAHKIDIELYDLYTAFPPELTLDPGEKFRWRNKKNDYNFAPFETNLVTIVFDDVYTVTWPDTFDRHFYDPTNYTIFKENESGILLVTFVFSDDDYRDAVNRSI